MKQGIDHQDKTAPVALCRLGENRQGVRQAVDLCNGMKDLDPAMSVLIKPNFVVWLEKYPYAPYGVITTSSVIEEVIKILKDQGVKNITVGDGCARNEDFGSTTRKLIDGLGLSHWKKKYGVRLVDFDEGEHDKMSFGPHHLKVSKYFLESDYIINLPALKTHESTRITLGFKNLKGCLHVKTKQSCHNPDHSVDEYLVYLAQRFYPNLTIIDGTYMLESGPMYTGKAHRTELIVAGRDMFSVDIVGASLMGVPLTTVKHLADFAAANGRRLDVENINIKGLKLEDHVRQVAIDTPYSPDGRKPVSFVKQKLEGFDLPFPIGVCTGCTYVFPPTMLLILSANKGEPFDDIELLAKGAMPSGHAQKTFLLGNCPIAEYKKSSQIKQVIPIPGCPPKVEDIIKILSENGVDVHPESVDRFFSYLVKRYDKENFPKAEYWLSEQFSK